ncbi:MAG: excisionase family DNA-binding protein [Anaerolineae bacterium]
MAGERAYITLKEAAHALSVHEQTIRNWGRRGIIRLVRLPGSRYRRVPTSEVARLKAQMAQVEPHTGAGVRLELPPSDVDLITQGRALADTIKEALAAVEPTTTFDEMMRSLRGRSWLS